MAPLAKINGCVVDYHRNFVFRPVAHKLTAIFSCAQVGKRMNFKKLFLNLAVIGVTCAMWAADSGTRLRCRVFDSGKVLISGAQLTLKSDTLTVVGYTNDEGEY